MRIVSVGAKGGVGKTTLALNLAGVMPPASSVELVDLDPSASLTLAVLGEPHPDPLRADPLPLEWRDRTTFRASGRTLASANEWDIEEHLKYRRSKDAVQIVDCSPALDARALKTMAMADVILVPIGAQPLDLPSLWDILAYHEELRMKGHVMAVLNRVQARRGIVDAVVSAIKSQAPGILMRTQIPEDVRVAEAPGAGIPVQLYAPASRGAEAYRKLAKEIYTRTKKGKA